MSILFLDDSPERTEKFKASYPEAVCVEAEAGVRYMDVRGEAVCNQ